MVRGIEVGTRAVTVGTRALQQTIPSGALTVDDFEDGGMTEYTNVAEWSVTSNQSFSGTQALEVTNQSAAAIADAFPGATASDLDNYPQKGQKWEWYFRFNAAKNAEIMECSFYRSGTGAGQDRISLRMQRDNNRIRIVRLGGDVTNAILATGSGFGNTAVDTWYRVEMIWDNAAGDITGTPHTLSAEVFDTTDGSSVDSASTTEDNAELNNNQGVRWRAENVFTSAGESLWVDNARITQDATA